ncbi:MAG: hypothetical protein AAB403_22520, partial [Planctomycetota bacterium]
MDGMEGALLRASGYLHLNVFNFFSVEGGFAIEKKTATVKVLDTKGTVDTADDARTDTLVDLLTVGASEVDAFAGLNGGTADALGLKLTGVDFALALASEQTVAAGVEKREWTTLKAQADSVAFIGVEGLTISVDTLNVDINRSAATAVNTIIDYTDKRLVVATGPTSSLTLDVDGKKGDLTRASGHVILDVFGFVAVDGVFGFEQSSRTVKVYNATGKTWADVSTDVLVFGMADVNAFAGYKGDPGDSDDIGLKFTNVDFALATFTETAGSKRKWTTIDSTIAAAAFVGIPDVTLAVDNTHIIMNRKAASDSTVIDFKAMQTAGDAFVATAGVNAAGEVQTVTFATDGKKGDFLQVYGHVDIDLFGLVTVRGGFAFERSTRSITLSNNTTANTSALAFGMTDVDALLGYAGAASDGSDDFGLRLSDVDLALVTFSEQGGRRWIAVDSNI